MFIKETPKTNKKISMKAASSCFITLKNVGKRN